MISLSAITAAIASSAASSDANGNAIGIACGMRNTTNRNTRRRRVLIDDVVRGQEENVERPEQKERCEEEQKRPDHLVEHVAVERSAGAGETARTRGIGMSAGEGRHRIREPVALVAAVCRR